MAGPSAADCGPVTNVTPIVLLGSMKACRRRVAGATGLPMSKRMSKTLAAEIADRTLSVLNPANRLVALGAALQRHCFPGAAAPPDGTLTDRAALIAWLQATYATRD